MIGVISIDNLHAQYILNREWQTLSPNTPGTHTLDKNGISVVFVCLLFHIVGMLYITLLEMRVLWPRSKNPYGSFAKPGVLSTAWGSFASVKVLWCTRQAQRVLWRHRLIEGSLNVTPWLIYASLPVSVWFFNEHNSSCMSYFWCIIKLILHKFICNILLNTYNIWNCYMVISRFM